MIIFFPRLNQWLSGVLDHRDQGAIDYSRETMLWSGLLLFIMKAGARSHMRHQMRTECFAKNIAHLSGQRELNRVPHDDSLVYFLGKSSLDDIEQVQVRMLSRLIRMKIFERYRLPGGYLPIAIDGVHVHTFEYPHCSECIVREDKHGNKQWSHTKVQASVVLPNKMCLPLASEWIGNEDGQTKQDCEQKATKRLIKKLRRYYPKLAMCVILDALYCGEPVFSALEDARMQWMVVFKKATMPEVYEWLHAQMKRYGSYQHQTSEESEVGVRQQRPHSERFTKEKPVYATRTRITQSRYQWQSGIAHWNNERQYNYLAARVEEDNKVQCDYEWLVSEGISKHINYNTVGEISNQGGRARWRIENEGNNMQKNGGYNLEHIYCKHPTIMKMFVTLLDMAHIINQLIEKGSLISLNTFGTIRNISRRMLEHMRTAVFKVLRKQKRPYIQIRWDSS